MAKCVIRCAHKGDQPWSQQMRENNTPTYIMNKGDVHVFASHAEARAAIRTFRNKFLTYEIEDEQVYLVRKRLRRRT